MASREKKKMPQFSAATLKERIKEGAVLSIPIVILESVGWIPSIQNILSFNVLAWFQFAVQALVLGFVAATVVYKVN